MLYIIKDKFKIFFGTEKKNTIKVCLNQDEVLSFLADKANLKKFKGEIEVERIIL